MKKTLLFSTLYSVIALGAASCGALTEGFFIIHNKHRDAKEQIQELKQELTACFSESKEKPSALDIYHCKLRQLLYPGYIDELGRIMKHADKQLPLLKKDYVEQKLLDKGVQQAILLVDKIRIERKLLVGIFEVDRNVKELSVLEKKKDLVEKQKIALLKEALKKNKQYVEILKIRVQEINGKLLIGSLIQEVFLDKLAYYIP